MKPVYRVAIFCGVAILLALIWYAGEWLGLHVTGLTWWAAIAHVVPVAFVILALVAGLREHRIVTAQQRLRAEVEASREALAESRKQLAAVLESTTDSVLLLDRDWNVVYFNHRAAETINRSDILRVGISIWELFPAALTSGEGDHYKKAIATGKPEDFELFVTDRQIWLGIQAYPTEDGLSIFFRDISEQKRVRDEMVRLAHHDSLTGLANRLLFQQRLDEARSARSDVAVLLLDLDHFKEVNDTLGHPVGDALLVATAQRMRDCLGPEVTIGRLGGDEFAAILTDFESAEEVGIIADRLISAASAPHPIGEQSVRVDASIGIATARGGYETADDIFKNADVALYAAKNEARGSFKFFEQSMHVELLRKQALRGDLAGAIERGEFVLAYQPLVDLSTKRVSSFEALLRWNHPQRGVVAPDQFIPLAEETGLIVKMGEWVLQTACEEATNWPEHVSVAVNLSSRQFSSELPGIIETALYRSGLVVSRLELEITETVLLRDNKPNMQMLRQLREMGLRIALDDFGTGFSSLAYLQSFPFSKIKIDRSFISGLPDNEESQAIVRSVIGLGQSLGLKVTAEGVETAEQLDWVALGCDEAQGFLLSPPVSAAEVAGVIEAIDSRAGRPKRRTPRLVS